MFRVSQALDSRAIWVEIYIYSIRGPNSPRRYEWGVLRGKGRGRTCGLGIQLGLKIPKHNFT
jgi:hypothetical protein